jgi:hypothetical protein
MPRAKYASTNVKPLDKRQRQLRNRVGACFGDVVAADGYRVKVTHVVLHKILRHVTHDLKAEFGRKDAGVLPLVFFQDVGLDRAAHIGQHPSAQLRGLGGVGRRAGYRLSNLSAAWSMAVFMNIAKMVGAGPLMVMLTEVLGSHRSKPWYNTFMSSKVAMLTPLLPTLP